MNRNDDFEQYLAELSQEIIEAFTVRPDHIPPAIPSDGYVGPHDKHPAMTFMEFIYYRFMKVQ